MTARILGTRIYPAPEPDAPEPDERDFDELSTAEQDARIDAMDATDLRDLARAMRDEITALRLRAARNGAKSTGVCA